MLIFKHIKRTFTSYRGRHFASRWVRTVLEKNPVKQAVGYQLAGAVALFSLFEPTATAVYSEMALAQVPSNEIVIEEEIKTETTLAWPVENPTITQKYRFGHSGVDIQDTNNKDVHPIDEGWVSKVSKSLWGYGTHIFIRHPNERSSLYAHLATVEVEEGQSVTRETTLGKMGSTGRASGIHLHLEIYQEGQAADPLSVLPDIDSLPILTIQDAEQYATPSPTLTIAPVPSE